MYLGRADVLCPISNRRFVPTGEMVDAAQAREAWPLRKAGVIEGVGWLPKSHGGDPECGSVSDMTFSLRRMTFSRHRLALQAGAGGSYLIMTQGGISMRFRSLVAILRHGGADLIALVFGLRQGRVGQQKRQPHGGYHYPFDHHTSHSVGNDRSWFYQ